MTMPKLVRLMTFVNMLKLLKLNICIYIYFSKELGVLTNIDKTYVHRYLNRIALYSFGDFNALSHQQATRALSSLDYYLQNKQKEKKNVFLYPGA